MNSKTIVFVGGGSIGHIAPSVAVWRTFKNEHPDTEALFVCADRKDDREFLTKENLPFTTIDAPKLGVSFLWKFPRALQASKKILSECKPDLIFAKGGYVSVPLCYVAHKMNIPIVLHESDAIMGNANRLIARWADKICLGFAQEGINSISGTALTGDLNRRLTNSESNEFIRHVVTGNPVRESIANGSKERGLQITGLSGDSPILLVIGGSQGAQALNDAITNQLDELLNIVQIIHITGRGKERKTKNEKRINGYFSTDFVTNELNHFYACSDIALSRAGASGIAELEANNIPTTLVPLRGVAHDHQYKNAVRSTQDNNRFLLLEQGELEKDLIPAISKLLTKNACPEHGRREVTNKRNNELPQADRQISKIIAQTLDS